MTPEQREKRLAELEWSCMTPDEHAARIVALEDLCMCMWGWVNFETCERCPVRDKCDSDAGECAFWDWAGERMRELGLAPEGLPTCE
ncbi:MAG: hypothetical protein IKE22_14275 [Atopobiaceae bacterium]|nr:hypothetical protein [Atopobiaceae bacterium]